MPVCPHGASAAAQTRHAGTQRLHGALRSEPCRYNTPAYRRDGRPGSFAGGELVESQFERVLVPIDASVAIECRKLTLGPDESRLL